MMTQQAGSPAFGAKKKPPRLQAAGTVKNVSVRYSGFGGRRIRLWDALFACRHPRAFFSGSVELRRLMPLLQPYLEDV
jgi:hypothetical protein